MISLDMIETEERSADISLLPGFSKRDEVYVRKNPVEGSQFSKGDLAGYNGEGDLWIVETEGWEYHDINGNQNEGEVYLHYAEEALNLEIAGYLDPERHFHGNNFVTGSDLYTLANRNLEEVRKKLDGGEVQIV